MIDIEVLKIALAKEVNAIETYQEMLSLITEEQKHRMMIEKKIAELTRN